MDAQSDQIKRFAVHSHFSMYGTFFRFPFFFLFFFCFVFYVLFLNIGKNHRVMSVIIIRGNVFLIIVLTLSIQSKICSRRHFEIWFLNFPAKRL